jgi:hypothetical protein
MDQKPVYTLSKIDPQGSQPSIAGAVAAPLAEAVPGSSFFWGAPFQGPTTGVFNASIVALRDGGFISIYQTKLGPTSLPSLKAQVYNADGSLRGAAYDIPGTTDGGTFYAPRVEMLSDGKVLIAADVRKASGTIAVNLIVIDPYNSTVSYSKVIETNEVSFSIRDIIVSPDAEFTLVYKKNGSMVWSTFSNSQNEKDTGSINNNALDTDIVGASFKGGRLEVIGELSKPPFSPTVLTLSVRGMSFIGGSTAILEGAKEVELVELDGGGFAAVWMADDGSGKIWAQRYGIEDSVSGARISAVGDRIQIGVCGGQNLTVEALPSGRWVVAWDTAHESQTGSEIRARIMDSSGEPVSDEFIVNQSQQQALVGGRERAFRAARGRSQPAHAADDGPFLLRHRLHREAGIVDEDHPLEAGFFLDRVQHHRALEGPDRLDVDHAEPAGRVRVVGVVFLDHLDDAHHRLALVGMVEEAPLAPFHGHQVLLGDMVAHAVPVGALVALRHLLVPGPDGRFGLVEPVGHDVITPSLVSRDLLGWVSL